MDNLQEDKNEALIEDNPQQPDTSKEEVYTAEQRKRHLEQLEWSKKEVEKKESLVIDSYKRLAENDSSVLIDLHDKDPRIYKNAKKIEKTDWKGLRKIVGNKWIPGMNVPFDPIAAKEAQKLKLKLVLVGKDLNNFKKFLDNKKFKGSVVEWY